MSQLVLPSLAGTDIRAPRTPFYNTKVNEALSGREYKHTWWTIPRYRWQLDFNILRGDSSLSQRMREWQQLVGHFMRHIGQGDSFLFADPEDQSVTDHGFAVGDGVTTAFQLQRSLAGDVTDAAGFTYHPQTKPYVNMLKNSSFETSTAGLANNWGKYGDLAGEPVVATIVPGANGGSAQRISWGAAATNVKGVLQTGVSTPAFVINQWYTVSVLARASPANVGKFIALGWNTFPSQTVVVSCPALSASWQRYVFQFLWTAAPNAELYFTISNVNTASFIATSTFGDLDFDLAQVTPGQWTAADLQPIETPAAATGTRTPAYWPATSDGFEPIFDLQAPPTIYQDGDWMGRRQLYPWTRTNLVQNSEQMNVAPWSPNTMSVTANATTAPDGTATADQFNEGAVATSTHYLSQGMSPVTGDLRRYSLFVKANNLPNIVFGRDFGDYIKFNLSTGVIDGLGPGGGGAGYGLQASGVVTSPLWPGWYRIWFTVRENATFNPAGNMFVFGTAAGGTYNMIYTGTSRTFYLWGADCRIVSDLGAPDPYIKTPTTAAVTVTDYTLSSTGVVTLPAVLPGPNIAFLSWDGSFYRRVRFERDDLPTERIAQYMHSAKSIQLVSVKP